MKSFLLFSILLLINSCMSTAQEIQSHKWENRVLIVLTNELENPVYQRQVQELVRSTVGLSERKLIIYYSTPNAFKQEIDGGYWEKSSQIYSRYKTSKSNFEIILVGLDSEIKLRNSDFTTCNKIFSLIDRMPMRRQEIRGKEKNN